MKLSSSVMRVEHCTVAAAAATQPGVLRALGLSVCLLTCLSAGVVARVLAPRRSAGTPMLRVYIHVIVDWPDALPRSSYATL